MTTHMNSKNFESTYAMLLRAEREERSFTETIVYALLILTMVLSVWQAAEMRVVIPENLTPHTIAHSIPLPVEQA